MDAGPDVPDWDALAPYWEFFEGGGLDTTLLQVLVDRGDVEPPVLHVGCGRGSLTALLLDRWGSTAVLGVDRSAPMCRRALHEQALRCVVGAARALPVADGAFRTVLCTSGVLEWIRPPEMAEVLRELGRVCAPSGQVVVAAACQDADAVWEVDQHLLVDAWFRGRPGFPESTASFDGVAGALGGRRAARELLLRSLPRTGRAVASAEMSRLALGAGLRVVRSQVDSGGTGTWTLQRASSAARPAPAET